LNSAKLARKVKGGASRRRYLEVGVKEVKKDLRLRIGKGHQVKKERGA